MLKVDTAYHSHHMKLVSNEYLDRLKGLDSGPIKPGIRFFSTVTGHEKFKDFGPSYWVENLVSPVDFNGAIKVLAAEMGQTPLNVIEIGPHRALAGPIRHSLAESQAKGLSYRYIPTLVRGQDSCISLMETGSSLFRTGTDLHIDAVASHGVSNSTPLTLRDLPSYHWNHTSNNWSESRLSKEYRFRRYPYHDLLGLRITTSTDSEPSWRIILDLNSLPWLKDHIVDNFIVFPGSGYLALAIEAIKQMDQDQPRNVSITGYHLKNISFKRTLAISDDANGVEVVLSLRQSSASRYNFVVSSVSNQGKWQEHCDGSISTTFQTALDEVEQTREADFRLQAQASKLKDAQDDCVQYVGPDELYTELASSGNRYGPSFAVTKGLYIAKSNSRSLSTIIIPDIAATMPAQFMQSHTIHPASFDALLHSCVLLFHRISSRPRGSTMPVFISDVYISAEIVNRPGQTLQVVCDLTNTFSKSSEFDIVVYQPSARNLFQPVLTISNGEMRDVGASQELSRSRSDNIFKMQWGLDKSLVTSAALESIVTTLQSDEAGMSPAEKAAALDLVCTRFIGWSVREVEQRGLTIQHDYRERLFSWMQSLSSSAVGQESLDAEPLLKEGLMEQLARLGLGGELVSKMGPHLTSILIGKTDALALLLEGDLLYRVYKVSYEFIWRRIPLSLSSFNDTTR